MRIALMSTNQRDTAVGIHKEVGEAAKPQTLVTSNIVESDFSVESDAIVFGLKIFQ